MAERKHPKKPPMAQSETDVRRTGAAIVPKASDLAAWESKAGLKSVKKMDYSDVPTVAADRPIGGEDSESMLNTLSKDPFVGNIVSSAPLTIPDMHIRPKHPSAARDIYAKAIEGEHADSGTLESRAKEWDEMPVEAKVGWQSSKIGKAAIKQHEAAIEANRTAAQVGANERKSVFRVKNAAIANMFPGNVQAKRFIDSGELTRESIGRRLTAEEAENPDEPRFSPVLDNPGRVIGVNSDRKPVYADPRKAEVMGMPSTQPESDWRKGWVPSASRAGVALNNDSSHFERLSNHIEELSNRPLIGQYEVKAPLLNSHLPEMWYNQHGFISDTGNTINPKQFDQKSQHLQSARESLARAARAHSMGMKDAALAHFNAATESVMDAADAWHQSNVNRGRAQAGQEPEQDYINADKVRSDYRNSLSDNPGQDITHRRYTEPGFSE